MFKTVFSLALLGATVYCIFRALQSLLRLAGLVLIDHPLSHQVRLHVLYWLGVAVYSLLGSQAFLLSQGVLTFRPLILAGLAFTACILVQNGFKLSLEEMFKIVEGSLPFRFPKRGKGILKVAMDGLELVYEYNNPNRQTDFTRFEIVTVTAKKTCYKIKFEDDDVAFLQRNGRKLSVEKIESQQPEELCFAHKILEIARRQKLD